MDSRDDWCPCPDADGGALCRTGVDRPLLSPGIKTCRSLPTGYSASGVPDDHWRAGWSIRPVLPGTHISPGDPSLHQHPDPGVRLSPDLRARTFCRCTALPSAEVDPCRAYPGITDRCVYGGSCPDRFNPGFQNSGPDRFWDCNYRWIRCPLGICLINAPRRR